MAFLFGGKKEPETLSTYKSEMRQTIRTTERELSKAERQESLLLNQIKTTKNLEDGKRRAREVVRIRAHKNRLETVKSHMTQLAQELAEVGSSQKTQEILAKTTTMLKKLNKQVSVSGAHKLMAEFEKASSEMQMKQEVVGESLETSFEVEGETGATEDVLNQVMEEAGLDLRLLMMDKKSKEEKNLGSLEERLEALRN